MYIYQIMSNSFGYLDNIIRYDCRIYNSATSILGRKTGHETKVYPGFVEKEFNMPKNKNC